MASEKCITPPWTEPPLAELCRPLLKLLSDRIERINNTSMCPAEGVWVLIEQQGEELQDGSLELVGEGRRIADKMHKDLTAVVLGSILDEQANLIAQHGAGRILIVEHPALNQYSVELHSQVLADVIRSQSPDVVLSVHSINGADLACRVAARLETGLVTASDRVDVNEEKLLVAVKPIYGGKASASFICPSARPQMATLNIDALALKTPDPMTTADEVRLKANLEPEKPKTQTVDFIPGDPRAMDLTEAEVVVAGGRGLGSKTNFKLVYELADVLGGSVGATRRAVDEEWITSDRQVGLTGRTVRPRLFISCGISGASQHTMGMKDSKAIVAVNTDRKAPIFEIADVGVVGDALEVIPELIARLREVMSQNSEPKVADAISDSRS